MRSPRLRLSVALLIACGTLVYAGDLHASQEISNGIFHLNDYPKIDRQESTEQALEELFAAIAKNEARQKEQAATGLDSLTYFMMSMFTDAGIPNAEKVAGKVREVLET